MNPLESVLKAMQVAQRRPIPDALAKAWVQPGSSTTGLQLYDLEAPAKMLYPVLTPLRNMIPRVGGGVGTAINWRAVTGINTTGVNAGVAEGKRGGVIQQTTVERVAAYRGLGLENYVTFEADYSSQGFQDLKALAVQQTLEALMIQEELTDLGGNTSLALGITPTATLATATTGGSLAALTYAVRVFALTLTGWKNASLANGILGQVTRTNANGTTDTFGGGSAGGSVAATQATTGATSTISATVAAVNGAFAYAWYLGNNASPGTERLAAITTINSAVFTTLPTTTQLASAVTNGAADNSTNTLVYDGILTQITTPGSGSYIKIMATGTAGTGTPLTSGGDGGVTEIDVALQSFWDNWKLSPEVIWVSSDVQRSLRKLIMTAGSTAAQRFVFQVGDDGRIKGGSMALSYLNPFGMPAGQDYAQGSELPIRLHPDLPAGTILFTTSKLPYKLNNVANILQMKTRKEYYQLEWPLVTRSYEYGVYFDGVLQNYFTPAFGIIANIGAS